MYTIVNVPALDGLFVCLNKYLCKRDSSSVPDFLTFPENQGHFNNLDVVNSVIRKC